MEPIKVKKAKVKFFEGLEIEGYQMPDGEFRVGLASASRALGFSRNWLSRVMNGEIQRTVKDLQGLGFSENIQKVSAQSNQGNWLDDTTIGLDDFNACIIYGTQSRKASAIALNKAFTRLSLMDFFRDAFGEIPLTIEEKRRLFYEAYAASISPEEWKLMGKDEIIQLALAGDERHLKGGYWDE